MVLWVVCASTVIFARLCGYFMIVSHCKGIAIEPCLVGYNVSIYNWSIYVQ